MIIQIEPWIDHEELDQLRRVIESTFVVEAELTKEFEEATRALTGAKHAIAMSNGTVALYCALKALNIGNGDEVIVPNITFIASANAIIMAGATPVFCEVTPDTFCIDAAKAARLINKKTKAIMPVHLYGQSADMVEICCLAKNYNLHIIEDAAQGVGVYFMDKHVGTFGDIGILSYYGNKTITCGEGGIVLTDSDEIAERCYRLKNHGRNKKGIFIHETIGFNFSFTEMQAAIGISQMNKLERIIQKKKKINDLYVSQLVGLKRFRAVKIDRRTRPVFWFTSFLSDDADDLSEFLLNNNVQTRRFFYPLHLQPCYRHLDLDKDMFKLSESIYAQGISLPSAYNLGEDDQRRVIDLIKKFYS